MENTSHFLIALSSWIFLLYKNSAERYGWKQGLWSLSGKMFFIGLISLILLFSLLPDRMSWKDITLLYLLSLFGSTIPMQIGKEYSQFVAIICFIIGWGIFVFR